MLGVFAVGRIINPRTARSQLIGGMTMGLSMALHEDSVIDPQFGHVVNHDFAEYHIAGNADVGSLEAVWLDEHDPHVNPMGSKGIGEICCQRGYGDPISYLTLEAGADVISSDGERVGKLEHVLADRDSDVFDGLVIDIHLGPGGQRFADADQVDELYERAVVLRVPATEIEKLPKPEPAPAVMESHGVEDPESPLRSKLHRAWDLISGNY